MNNDKIKECTELAAEILKNFDQSDLPAEKIVLKCLRLYHLLDDKIGMSLFKYESSGYPSKMTRFDNIIAAIAGRVYYQLEKDKNGTNVNKQFVYKTLISEIDEMLEIQKIHLSVSSDPNISISSANPNQFIQLPVSNSFERNAIVNSINNYKTWRSKIVGCLYNYILITYNRLAYGNIVDDIFTRSRLMVNKNLSELCPEAINKFVSVYNNMDSDNSEDWANAVHSCRRILQDVADKLYPPKKEDIVSNGKTIKVGKDQYINRLIQFISSKEGSKTFANIVGADLESIGNRLDAIYEATCKGSHTDLTKEEASRYIIHTYLLISDILLLNN